MKTKVVRLTDRRVRFFDDETVTIGYRVAWFHENGEGKFREVKTEDEADAIIQALELAGFEHIQLTPIKGHEYEVVPPKEDRGDFYKTFTVALVSYETGELIQKIREGYPRETARQLLDQLREKPYPSSVEYAAIDETTGRLTSL